MNSHNTGNRRFLNFWRPNIVGPMERDNVAEPFVAPMMIRSSTICTVLNICEDNDGDPEKEYQLIIRTYPRP